MIHPSQPRRARAARHRVALLTTMGALALACASTRDRDASVSASAAGLRGRDLSRARVAECPAPPPSDWRVTLEAICEDDACPRYRVTIAGDGTFAFHGLAGVTVLDAVTGRVSDDELAALRRQVQAPALTRAPALAVRRGCERARRRVRVSPPGRDADAPALEREFSAACPGDEALASWLRLAADVDAVMRRRGLIR